MQLKIQNSTMFSQSQRIQDLVEFVLAIEVFWRYTFLSDYLTDVHAGKRKKKKNFVKNCPQWGWNPWPPDHHSNALPTELGKNLLGWRFLKWALFVSCTTSHVGLCSFLESIEHDFIKAMKIQVSNWMLT